MQAEFKFDLGQQVSFTDPRGDAQTGKVTGAEVAFDVNRPGKDVPLNFYTVTYMDGTQERRRRLLESDLS